MNNEIELNPTPKGSADLNSLPQGNIILDSLPKGVIPLEVPPTSEYTLYLEETQQAYEKAMEIAEQINTNKQEVNTATEQAKNYALNSQTSATNAEQSAIESANSANEASKYSVIATTKADEASTSATNAFNSAEDVREKSDIINTKAEEITNSLNIAIQSAEQAQESAINAENSYQSTLYLSENIKSDIMQTVVAEGYLKRLPVDALPDIADADTHTIYMVLQNENDSSENNYRIEYMAINGIWEIIGSSQVDLTPYALNTELQAEINNREQAITNLDTNKANKTNVYTKTEVDTALKTKVDKNQGIENSGKPLIVGADGNIIVGNQDSGNNIIDLIYPIGSIYMSTVATSPAVLFNIGEWERIGGGRCLIDASEPIEVEVTEGETEIQNPYPAGSEGGSADAIVPYHTHEFIGTNANTGTESADHTHSGNTGYISANHIHYYGMWGSDGGTPGFGGYGNRAKNYDTSTVSANHYHGFTTGGRSAAHTHNYTPSGTNSYVGTDGNIIGANMQPYLAVYMWKRVA